MKLLIILSVFFTLFASISALAGGPKIGFILSTMQEERYQRDKAVFEATVKKLGGEVVFAS